MTRIDTTTLYSTLRDIHIVTHNVTTISETDGLGIQDMVTKIVTILGKFEVLDYFFKYGAATAWVLRFKLGMKKRQTYRALEVLRVHKILQAKTTVGKQGCMKRKATVWGTPDATEEQIRDAHSLHLKLMMPNYCKAEKLAQTYLDTHTIKPSKEELICFLSENGTPRHEIPDLARTVRNIIYRS